MVIVYLQILKSVVYMIFMKIVPILIKVLPVNSDVLVDLKNIESPASPSFSLLKVEMVGP